jgi:hypothetical protein
MSAFFSFLSQDQPLFHGLKANWGLKLSRISRTPENDRLYIYSLGVDRAMVKVHFILIGNKL